MNGCLNFCKAIVTLRSEWKRNGYLWNGNEGLLLEHGVNFDPAPRPKGVRKGTLGRCYSNAGRLVMNRTELFYCEGFATTKKIGLPLPHAWACTKEGVLIDPTWDDGAEYIGVIFKRSWLMKRASETGFYGILFEDHRDNWITLRTPAERWLEVL